MEKVRGGKGKGEKLQSGNGDFPLGLYPNESQQSLNEIYSFTSLPSDQSVHRWIEYTVSLVQKCAY